MNRKEVAKICGVSTMTVTRVVSNTGYVSSETRKKVQKVVDEQGYIPNRIAANLVRNQRNEIAIILPDLTNPYYLQVIDAMMQEVKNYGYILSIFKANEQELGGVLQEVISNRVAGVVNYASAFPPLYTQALHEVGTKIVRENMSEVGFTMSISYEDAIMRAVRCLKENGAKNILFISGMNEAYTFLDLRANIFLKSMESLGLPASRSDIVLGNYPEEKAFVTGFKTASLLVDSKRKFDAAFCMNDMMAFGLINGLKKKNIRIPDEVAVVGFDNIYMSEFYDPSLSTIATDINQEAQCYMNYITGRNMGQIVELKAQFIERESTLKPV